MRKMASNQVMDIEDSPNTVDSLETATASCSQNEKSDENKAQTFEINSRPVCMIVLGMAGSGKTSFVKRLTQLGNLQNMKPYVINLDPACQEVPYHTNIGESFLLNNKFY